MDHERNSTIRVTCAPMLADFLADEIRDLGFEVRSVQDASVEITGNLYDAMRLNVWLRTGMNVLFLLRSFECDSADDLYRLAGELPWESLIPSDQYLTVMTKARTPSIDNTMFASMKLKDAIVDRILKHEGRRPDSGPDRHRVVVNLYWFDNKAWIYLNTSGQKLADRGYRKMPFKAPLSETLAAGIIRSMGYDGSVPLVAPMCGSGTLAIEAALMALNRPPGLLRQNFGIQHIKGFDHDRWKTLRVEARKQGKKTLDAPILASDLDPDAIFAAKQNAKTAGVDHLIDFTVCDYRDTPLPDEPGMLVMNPAYGERLGEHQDLVRLYPEIGDFFKKRCTGWRAFIFTGNLELAKTIGLRTSSRVPFSNSGIECRLLEYELYAGTRKAKYQPPAT